MYLSNYNNYKTIFKIYIFNMFILILIFLF